jgi:arsenite methyltransferase
LPDAIRNSIEAYIGCLSGAVLKDKYLSFIKKAGFEKIKVVSEANFPVDEMVNDVTAKTVINELRLEPEQIKGIGHSVASIKVSAIKPT